MKDKINIEFTESRSKRRLMIHVYPDGRVVVAKHPRVPRYMALKLVEKKMPWIRKRLEYFKTAKIYDWKDYKNVLPGDALKFVKEKIEKFNAYYKFNFGAVKIKEYKGMWGACIDRKNLVFNIKIAGLPHEQADYIIVHELCHLQEFNHSKKFWKLVSEQIPDFKRIKQDLKLYSYY